MAGSFVYSDFKELSPVAAGENTQESYDAQSGTVTATRYFVGSWANRKDFIFNYLFQPTSLGEGSTLFLKPAEYPDLKGLYASNVQVRGAGIGVWDADEEKTVWERARITVQYTRSPQNQSDESDQEQDGLPDYLFVDEAIDSHVELLTIPGAKVVANEAVAAVNGLPAVAVGDILHEEGEESKVIASATIVLNRNRILVPPWEYVGYILGSVNSNTFITPSGFICPAGTLRFDGPSGNTKVNVFDQTGLEDEDAFPIPIWDFSLKFEFNVEGWNKKLVNGKFIDVLVGDQPKYKKRDFWPLVFGTTPDFNFLQQLAAIEGAVAGIQAGLLNGLDYHDPAIDAFRSTIKTAKSNLGFRV